MIEQKKVRDIFEAQIIEGYCRRMDIVVHYLAIENYYGKNDFGFDLCLKVHDKRTRGRFARSVRRIEGFKRLVSKTTKENFNTKKYPLEINFGIMDIVQGAHRMAFALYFGIDTVYARNVRKRKRRVDFGWKWFEKKGFDQSVIDILLNKKQLIMDGFENGMESIKSN